MVSGASGAEQWTAPRVVRNTVLNFAGHAIPILAGLFAIPLLIAELGTSRFGVLTLAWMAVGYFGLFDLGLGRAVTKLIAERIGTPQEHEITKLTRTALLLLLVFGIVASILAVAVAPWLTRDVLRIPAELQAESLYAFWLLALSLPVVITSAGLRGALEGMHRFGCVNAIRIPTGVFTFVGPLLVLPFSDSLVAVVAVLLVGRVGVWVALAICWRNAASALLNNWGGDLRTVPLLLGFAGWMTVTNVVGPLMVYMDRLLIGATVSAAAVAYYATPYEIITKMWLVPGALLGVLFPAFSAGLRQDPEWVTRTFQRSTLVLLLSLFPMALLIVLFAEEGLTIWLGAEFARESAGAARWLAMGVFINSLALVPFNLLQGAGRPDLTAKLHLVELPPYLFGLWWCTMKYGIDGAALMWTLRVTFDAVLLYVLVVPVLPRGADAVRRTSAAAALGVSALALAAVPDSVPLKIAYSSLMLLLTGILAWKVVLRSVAPGASLGWSGRT